MSDAPDQSMTAGMSHERMRQLAILCAVYRDCDHIVADWLAQCERRGVTIACRRGCFSCCLRPTIPLTQAEIAGISWYLSEKLPAAWQIRVQAQLRAMHQSQRCPFLVRNACLVYPLRPLACRIFFVKDQACRHLEDVNRLRPQDIVTPDMAALRHVLQPLLGCFGYLKPEDQRAALDAGRLFQNSRPLHEYDWTELAAALTKTDKRR